ncbi:MAG TPA: biotin-dependent carboxyltransferase family protein [Longimicrobiales bacterium]|nr:biotin-dependent carboxyltransferase family protein [Longimicrobiales bacterium]
MIGILRAGLLTTVQDLGRPGMQQHGIATGGAMDRSAHRIANLLVGNHESAATLECTMLGPELEFVEPAILAIGGGDLGAMLDGEPAPLWCPFAVQRGSVITFMRPRSGCRAYIAIAGGIEVPVVLGSRSTDLIAQMGGVEGRALRTGDELTSGPLSAMAARVRDTIQAEPRRARSAGRSLLPRHAPEPVVRVIRGPEHDRFSAASRELLAADSFVVTPQSNRMGIRLTGPALCLAGLYDLSSSPVAAGTIQVPPSGDPIVLMADHQTIGGYPRMASVISLDLRVLAQAPPGLRIRFREIGIGEAQSLYLEHEHDLRMFSEAIRVHYSS